MAKRPPSPTTERQPNQRKNGTALQQDHDQQRHQDSPLRRLQQLVRSLRLLGSTILWRQERSTHQRRTKEMDRRGQTPNQRHPQTRHNQFPRIQSRREHQSLPATSTRPPQQAQRQVRRRQKPQGVQRRSTSTPRIPNRTRTARRPHTGRSQHTVEPSCQRGRHLQVIRRNQETLRNSGRNRRQGHRGLLPHRRAFQLQLVCSKISARIPQGPEL